MCLGEAGIKKHRPVWILKRKALHRNPIASNPITANLINLFPSQNLLLKERHFITPRMISVAQSLIPG
jgi:hypothetical protein